jgi:acyl transferase domain-containing protein
VIKGFAVNNDGSAKIGYTAPSVDGQAAVITEALSMAGVNPETVSYIEAHGTGTALGDPIEIAALTQAFRAGTQKRGFCAVGSLKTNIGHLDTTAGVAGLIKTALALKHRLLPPSLNFEQPNPQIDFESSPFFVNTKLRPWESVSEPRRAGVSSFGIGGTNAHVVLEEAPEPEAAGESRSWQTLVLSAKTETALDQATRNLAHYLKQTPEASLADTAYTLKLGRKAFAQRRVVVCKSVEDAVEALEAGDSQRCFNSVQETGRRSLVFMFPGGGAQYVNMGRDLYRTEPVFQQQIDRCAELLQPMTGFDLRDYIYPDEAAGEGAAREMKRTSVGLPALFSIEYALSKLWMSWGLQPEAMIGHSLGEYTAACLAGVFSLKDALSLVTLRGQLIEELPDGAMLSVSLPEEELRPLIEGKLSLAAINGPEQCVVSGSKAAIDEIAPVLAQRNVEFRTIHIAAAGHSEIVDPILARFTEFARTLHLHPPRIAYVSNVTGDWITPEQATDPAYWGHHLRRTVRFADGLGRIMEEPNQALLEVGPGQILSTLAKLQPEDRRAQFVISSMRHPYDAQPDDMYIQAALSKVWLAGVEVDWHKFYSGEQRRRVPLPTYPFERQRYWVDAAKPASADSSKQSGLARNTDVTEWFYIPSWKRSMPPKPLRAGDLRADGEPSRWLVFAGEAELDAELTARLRLEEQDVVAVSAGDGFRRTGDNEYAINPRNPGDYLELIKELASLDKLPETILHCWNIDDLAQPESNPSLFEASQLKGYFSLLYLAQALDREAAGSELLLMVLSNNLHDVAEDEKARPEKATLLGACKVIQQEHTNITCRSVDMIVPFEHAARRGALVDQLLAEAAMKSADVVVAYRGKQRLVQSFEQVRLERDAPAVRPLREKGVYVITGGLGKVGLLLSGYLARTRQARLALFSRSPFPARVEWEQWLLATNDEENAVSGKIRKLLELEEYGAEVEVLNADVTSEEQMREVFRRVEERFGEIHGVIHAAGVLRGESFLRPLTEIGFEESQIQFASKVQGSYALEKVLRERQPDFCLLLSSNASVLGGMGFIAYAAANGFLDAFAADRNKESRFPWISSSWDGWLADETMPRAMRTSMDEYAMTPTESTDAFRRVVTQATVGHVVVSPGNLSARLDLWVRRETLRKPEPVEEETLVFQSRPNLRTGYAAPGNEVEEAIAKIWQKLLGVEQAGIHDNFFELGGHSLLATQVMSKVRETFNVELSLRTMFEAPTVAGLAEKVSAARQAARQDSVPPLVPIPRDRELPLSYAQARLWFLDQLEPGNPAYNLPAAVRLAGRLDIPALARTFDEIRRRHEALRTSFVAHQGHGLQLISPDWRAPLPVVDLEALAPAQREAQAQKLAQQEAQEPFDLSRPELLRVRLLRLGADEHILLLTMHHIISDGWSMGVLVREVSQLYTAYAAGEESPLAELSVQYADYAAWQREYLQGERLEEQLAYWRKQLEGAGRVELAGDRERGAQRSYRGGHERVVIEGEVGERLAELSREEGATLYMTLLGSFAALLQAYTGGDEVVVGTPVAGRNRTEVEGLIGFFINTLVMRTEVRGEESFRELLGRVREVVLAAYAHQDLPFEKLVQALQPERNLSYAPLFQVWFVLQNLAPPAVELPGLTLSTVKLVSEVARHDLRLDLTETPHGYSGSLQYSADLFEPATVARMARHYEMLVSAIAANPDAKLSELKEAMFAEERKQQMIKAKEFEASDRQSLKRLRRKPQADSGNGKDLLPVTEASERTLPGS